MLSDERGEAGRVELKLHEAAPPPGLVPVGALESDTGVHGRSGVEFGSHTFIENQGAIESSKKWVMSLPGLADGRQLLRIASQPLDERDVVARARHVRDERIDGSSWPM